MTITVVKDPFTSDFHMEPHAMAYVIFFILLYATIFLGLYVDCTSEKWVNSRQRKSILAVLAIFLYWNGVLVVFRIWGWVFDMRWSIWYFGLCACLDVLEKVHKLEAFGIFDVGKVQ